jgi:hypothetical protein
VTREIEERRAFLKLKWKQIFKRKNTKCLRLASKKLNRWVQIFVVKKKYGINSVISGLVTFVEGAETGQFEFLIMFILVCFTCSWRHHQFKWQPSLFSSFYDGSSYCLNDKWGGLVPYITIFLGKWQILLQKFNLIFDIIFFYWPQTKTNNHLRLLIKFNANVEIIPRQPFGTHRQFVHRAQ